MGREIDERVVEMRFDNKQFESGAKESISTLDKLKQSLNLEKAGKAFDLLNKKANNVNLSGISKSVAALEKRFSTLGVAGMQVISNITNSLQSKVTSALSSVSSSIIEGGKRRAMNIENAHFQLQALLKDEEKVQAVMDDAMQSVDGTAYAYDEAAKAASQFSATGLQAGKDMQAALSGITGVAAMTNSSYESISMIFTTVAGNGRLMGDQLLQLSSRGLNAASTIKDYFNAVLDGSKSANAELTAAIKSVSKGTKVTEGDIRDLVSKGQISFSMFSAAMTDAFGDSAKRANETFTGALSNVKAALSRIGAEFFSPLYAQNSEVVKLFNILKDKVNDFKKEITFADGERNIKSFSSRFTDMVLRLSKSASSFISNTDITGVFEAIYNIADGIGYLNTATLRYLKPIGKAFKDVFGDIINVNKIKELTSNFKSFAKSLRDVDSVAGQAKLNRSVKNLYDTFKGVFDVGKTIIWLFKEIGNSIAKNLGSTKDANTGFLDLTASFGQNLSAMSEWIQNSEEVKGAIEKIGEIAGKVKEVIGKFWDTINGAKEKSKSPFSGVQEELGEVGKSFQKLGKIYDEFIDPFISSFDFDKYLAGGIIGGILLFSKKIVSVLGSILSKKRDIEKIPKIFDKIGGVFTTWQENIKANSIKSIAISIGILAASIWALSQVDTKKMYAATGAITVMSVILMAALSKFNNSIDMGDNVLSHFGQFIKDLNTPMKKLAKSASHWISSRVVVNVGKSMALMAASIVSIAAMYSKDPKAVDYAVKVVGIIAAAMGVIMVAISKLSDKIDEKQTNTVAKAVVSISASLYLMILSLDKLFKIKLPKNYGVHIAIFAGILGALTGITYLLSKLDKTKAKTTPLIALSASLYIAVSAVKKLFSIELPKNYGVHIGILVGILGGLVGVTVLLSKLGKAKGRKGSTTPLIALCTSLYIATAAVAKLFSIELPKNYGVHIGILAGIFGGLVGVTILLSKLGKTKVKTTPLLALAGSLYIATAAVAKLFSIELPKNYGVHLGILAGIFGGLVGVTILLSKLGKTKVKTTPLLALAGSLYIATAAVAKLFSIELPKNYGVHLGILAGILVALIGTTVLLSKFEKTKGRKGSTTPLIALCTSLYIAVSAVNKLFSIELPKNYRVHLGILAGILVALIGTTVLLSKLGKADGGRASTTPLIALCTALYLSVAAVSKLFAIKLPENYDVYLKILAGIFAGLGIMLLAINKLQSSAGNALQSITTLLPTLVIMITVAALLEILSDNPWENMLASGTAMSEVLLSVSAAIMIMSHAKINVGSIGAFLGAIVMLGTVTAALYILAQQDYNAIQAAGDALTKVMLAMSVAMAATIAAGLLAPAAITGIGIMTAMVVVYTALIAALGAIFKSDDAKGLINGGIDILNRIATGIGEFAGNIVKGFLNTVADSLPNIAVKLSAFAIGLQPFMQTMGKVKPEVADGVGSICKALLMITGAELLNGIMEFFGGGVDWEGFKTKMESFGEAIKVFANKVEGVSEKDVKGAAAAAKVMLALQENLPKEGGWMQKVFGEQMDLETFGDQLVSFGKAITKFAAKVKGLSPDCADAARTAGQTMAELANSLPEESSWKSTIFGGKTIDLDEFGDQIFTFGDCMVKFSNKVSGISSDAVKKAKDCGDIMNTLAGSLGEKDGLWQKLAGGGNMTLADFGDDLIDFGEDMRTFSNTVSGVSVSSIGEFRKEITRLLNLGSSAGGGIENIKKLSKAITELSKSGLKEIGTSFTKGGASIVPAINATMSKAVKEMEGFKSKFTKAAKSATGSFGGVITVNVMRQASSIKKSMVMLGNQVGNGMAQGIKESAPKVKAAAKQLANAVDREVKNALDIHSPSRLMRTRGDQIGTGLAQGIGDSEPKVSKKVNGITKAIISTLATTNFVKSGKHLSNNLIDMLDSVFNKAHKTMKRHEMKFDIVAKANALYAKVTKSTKKFYDDQADLQRKYDREKEKYEKQKEKKQEAEQKLKEAKQRAKEAKEARNEAYGIKKKEQTKAQKKAQADRDLAKANKELAKAEAEAAKYGVSTADKKAAAAEKNRKTAEKNAKTAKQDKNTAAEQKKIGEQEKKFGEIKEKTANKNEKSAKKESENSKKNENTSKKNAENAKKDSKSSKTKEKNANRDSKSADKNAKTAEKNAKTAEKNAKTAEKNKKISEVEAKPKAIGNKMDPITEEEQFWINLLRVKQNGADAAEYLDMSYKEFQAKTLQDVASIIKEYTDQLEQERDSILGSMNLFADVEEEDPMSMADLQTYMEKNVQKIAEFQTAFSKLMARVKGTALEGLVSEMDLSDYSVVMALAGATDEELQRYAETYQRGVDSATEIAKLNMQDVQKNAENQLQDIFNTKKPINLFDFTKAWDGTAEGMKTFLDNLDKDETPKKIGRKLNKITSGAISDKLKEMSLDFANQGKQAGKDVGNAVKEGITDVMEEDPNVMKDQVDTYIDGVKDEKGVANRAGTSVANAAVKGLESRESQFYMAGYNSVQGFIDGMQAQLEAAREIAAELAEIVSSTINENLDIHSPSRVLMWSGNQAGIGFVLGLEQYIAVAGQVAKRMGDRTSSKLEDGFKGLSRIINSEDIHVDPTITPQVDLTNVRNAADEMNDLFNRAIRMKQMDIQAMDVSIRSQKAASTPSGQAASGTVIEQKFEFNQTNTSPKALSAIDIYRQTNNQFSQLKGVLSNDTRRYSH